MKNIRNATSSDFESIVKLNESEVKKTSSMNLEQLKKLAESSAYFKVITADQQVIAFLIALAQGESYQSDNYVWFGSRFERFLYVDRIVVSAKFAGCGIGSKLYDDLFMFARQHNFKSIACEYNLVPPNPESCAFHNKYGFREVGTQWLDSNTKQVSLQIREIEQTN